MFEQRQRLNNFLYLIFIFYLFIIYMKKQLEISSPLRDTKKHKTEKSNRNRNDNLSHSFISGMS